jgi:hypothetical protein
MRKLIVLTVALVALAIPASAEASTTIYHAGSCRATGEAACTATGTATRPLRIRVHVTGWSETVPAHAQSVIANWTVTCRHDGRTASRSGSAGLTTPVSRVIGHPFRRPGSCTVMAHAALNPVLEGPPAIGVLHVWITYTRW